MAELDRTDSSFTNNPKANRAEQVRRDDDTIKTQACTIYDHDFAILTYLRDTVKPKIIENDAVIDESISDKGEYLLNICIQKRLMDSALDKEGLTIEQLQ